ncbi:type I iterative polyketide synthase [Penicillium fimorum]|uniref:Type I iterative polyketide synthase n=1 Tax=Penicillium fimorum TaxID=1882269 RepID=A0A9W9XVC2_9EURO|nr:type I iterative polyketide synthase [Penicillium fimorum]
MHYPLDIVIPLIFHKVPADSSTRQTVTDSLIQKQTSGFSAPVPRPVNQTSSRCVLYLGSHILDHLAEQPSVRKIVLTGGQLVSY